MILNKYRRKPDIAVMDKENYERHISRLEALKANWSPNFKKVIQEQKKLQNNLSSAHKNHFYSRKHGVLQKNIEENMIKKINFNRVKSVVKNEFSRQSLVMPPKHLKRSDKIDAENEKIFLRIMKTRPKVIIQSPQVTQRFRNQQCFPQTAQNTGDFSKIFESSKLNKISKKNLQIRLGKAKTNIKLGFQFQKKEVLKIMKDSNELYMMQVKCGDLKAYSENVILQEFVESPFFVNSNKKYLQNDFTITFIRLLGQKQLLKGSINFDIKNILAENTYVLDTLKELTNEKGKKIGQVQVFLSIKDKKKKRLILDASELKTSK